MNEQIRRKDRVISREEAYALLDSAEYGVLSLVDERGIPYGLPIHFVREENTLIFHCALEGRKLDCLRHQPRASFCVVGKTQVVPDKFMTLYESAVLEGSLELTGESSRKYEDLMKFCVKYSPEHLEKAKTTIEKSLQQTAILEFHIESVSGKAKRTSRA